MGLAFDQVAHLQIHCHKNTLFVLFCYFCKIREKNQWVLRLDDAWYCKCLENLHYTTPAQFTKKTLFCFFCSFLQKMEENQLSSQAVGDYGCFYKCLSRTLLHSPICPRDITSSPDLLAESVLGSSWVVELGGWAWKGGVTMETFCSCSAVALMTRLSRRRLRIACCSRLCRSNCSSVCSNCTWLRRCCDSSTSVNAQDRQVGKPKQSVTDAKKLMQNQQLPIL